MHDTDEADSGELPRRRRPRFSLLELLMFVLVVGLGVGFAQTLWRLRTAESELAALRRETGYLLPSADDEIAATRLPSDRPLTFRMRVRVPESASYRITYSSFWPKSVSAPRWYGAVKVPAGESVVTVQILKDLRDERWKIAAMLRGPEGTRRIATVLPEDQVPIFRSSADWLSAGVTSQTWRKPVGQPLRLLDERMLVGEGAMMLYGDGPPQEDLSGVFAELQPDVGAI